MSDSCENKSEGCPFCDIPKDRTIAQNELAFVIRDGYPVTPLHTLVIPKRHVSGLFDLGAPEMNACNDLLFWAKDAIGKEDASVAGFNVGVKTARRQGKRFFTAISILSPGGVATWKILLRVGVTRTFIPSSCSSCAGSDGSMNGEHPDCAGLPEPRLTEISFASIAAKVIDGSRRWSSP